MQMNMTNILQEVIEKLTKMKEMFQEKTEFSSKAKKTKPVSFD